MSSLSTPNPFRGTSQPFATTIVDAPLYLNNDEWWLQEKMDGERRQLVITEEGTVSANRDGMLRHVPINVTRPGRLHLDGELIGKVYHAFDCLYCDEDLERASYAIRYERLERAVAELPTAQIVVVPTARTTAEKRNLWKLVMNRDGEGVVAKRWDTVYIAGRNLNQRKLKFWRTITAVVGNINVQRSVEMRSAEGADIGTCPIPTTHRIPDEGTLIEVRYLYAYPESKHLAQPVLLRERTDVSRADTLDALVYKADA